MKKCVFLSVLFNLLLVGTMLSQTPPEPYPPVSGSFSGVKVPHSPDPLVAYRWAKPQAADDLEIYTLSPVSVQADKPANATVKASSIHVTGACNLMFDFGQVNAAWLEFDSENLSGEIEASISEFNEPAVFNAGSEHPKKTARPVRYGNTWRLELNKGLYEGVRFAWIHIRQLDRPADISAVRLVCQIKPANYEGSFSCSDTMLTRIWYTGAYDVKLNLLKEFFGAILMERSDRHSWTGDAHPSQAASMVAFGNYDFVKANLRYTSTQFNGIASYSLYWVLSLIDYYNYTGDKALLDEMLTNACDKLEVAYKHYGQNPSLNFYGWDERLGAGFENPNDTETQNAYKMLSIRVWNEFSAAIMQAGYTQPAAKYRQYADEKIAELRKNAAWTSPLGVHAAADAVNAGFINAKEQENIWQTAFSDRLQRVSYSPFNQFFIIQSLARMQRYDEALATIDDCWGGQLRYGATTFFEVFRPSWNDISRPNDAPVNNQCGYTSLTHPWSAGVTKWLSEEILGVKPTQAGFSAFIIKPHLSKAVTWVKGSVPTLHGTVAASFDLTTGEVEVTIPAGTTATLAIPKAGRTIRSVSFKEQKRFSKSEDADYLYYAGLPEGQYRIKVTYAGKLPDIPVEPLVYAGKLTVKEDISTRGNWKGRYGSKGYLLCNSDSLNNRILLPDFISPLVFNKNGNVHWASGTTDTRALLSVQDGVATRSIGAFITRDPNACDQTMTIDIPVRKGQSYKLSLYFVDWDRQERRSAIEIFDLTNKNLLLPVYMVRDYVEGKYVTFEFDRPVRIRIDHVRGTNAALSGIFFD
ncbi:MAG: hypothetical protein LBN37_06100 [Bacteroidales bacterium]|nr:hypothetical protein [Bacteroidales bacterium]